MLATLMDTDKIRQTICFQAARLLMARKAADFQAARWTAARALTRQYLPSEALPTDMEIREMLQQLSGSDPSAAADSDRFDVYRAMLEPADHVLLPRDLHPEGDLLYHSLQVFHLAFEEMPWDEEFLTAALLHDIGYGIDPKDAHEATLAAVGPHVSDRTFWLIEYLPLQHGIAEDWAGARAKRRIRNHPDEDALRILADCDLNGRVPGREVPALDEALAILQELDQS